MGCCSAAPGPILTTVRQAEPGLASCLDQGCDVELLTAAWPDQLLVHVANRDRRVICAILLKRWSKRHVVHIEILVGDLLLGL